jgi:hypothetical protein
MLLPSDQRCREVLEALVGDKALTSWERDFVESNLDRQTFSDRQKEAIAKLIENYDV